MTAPDRDVTMTFVSVPCETKAAGWQVKVTFPANAGAADDLQLACYDGTEAPMAAGTPKPIVPSPPLLTTERFWRYLK